MQALLLSLVALSALIVLARHEVTQWLVANLGLSTTAWRFVAFALLCVALIRLTTPRRQRRNPLDQGQGDDGDPGDGFDFDLD